MTQPLQRASDLPLSLLEAVDRFQKDSETLRIAGRGKPPWLARLMYAGQVAQLAARATALLERAAALEAENRSLVDTKRDLETVVYAISHDLRAPLRAISGFASLLEDDVGITLPAAAKRDLVGIRGGVARMQEMIDCWVRIARCEHAEIRRRPVDLTVLAHEVLQDLRVADPQRTVLLAIAPGLTAEADRALVRELLQNLLGNAWKFTQGAASTATIEVGAQRDCNEMRYFVRDNGVGFDPANAVALFRPFGSLHSAVRFQGEGLGLAIAQRIAERHGGRVWAEGTPGRGATFWFTLCGPNQPAEHSRTTI